MATIVEVGIKNIRACIIMDAEGGTPQLLATYDTVDSDGSVVRSRVSPDWFPETPTDRQQAILGMIASFIRRAKAESGIPAQ